MKFWRACSLALAAAGAAASACAQTPSGPYQVDVWGDALFGADGKIEKLEVPEATEYPAPFVERLKKQFAAAKIPPVKDEAGNPATFQTGVRMTILVTPDAQGGSKAQVKGVSVGPRVVKRYAASRPDDAPEGMLQATVRCMVGVEGRCTEVQVTSDAPISPTFRRWCTASMNGYRFEPQRVGGKPVPGEYTAVLLLESIQYQPPDFRDATQRLPGR